MNATMISAIIVAAIAVGGIAAVVVLNDDGGDDRDTITVTMSWQKDIVEDIVGDNYRVVSMMGSNVSPHEAYSTPSNVSDLYTSKIYFKIGSGVEWETAFIDAVSGDIPSSVLVVDTAGSIEYTALPNTHHHHEGGEEDEDHEESAYDAHIWTSPDILRKVAKLVCDKVSELDPDNASDYQKNLESYNAKADAVNASMTELAGIIGTGHAHIMVWHPAWQYLINQYSAVFGMDLHQESVEEDGEVTPVEAVTIIKGEGCSYIFVSTTDEGYEGRAALEEAGITVYVVNPTADDMLEAISEFIGYLESEYRS